MPLFVMENKDWVDDPGENAQYQRLARLWNRIHSQLLAHPEAISTGVIRNSVFFRFDEELLLCDNFELSTLETGVGLDDAWSLNDFSGQGEEDLRDLADDMEAWLQTPHFIERQPQHLTDFAVNVDLADRRNHTEFQADYLYLVDA